MLLCWTRHDRYFACSLDLEKISGHLQTHGRRPAELSGICDIQAAAVPISIELILTRTAYFGVMHCTWDVGIFKLLFLCLSPSILSVAALK